MWLGLYQPQFYHFTIPSSSLSDRLDEIPLCGSRSSFKGSDGASLMGLDQRSRSSTPSFIARTASWGEFPMFHFEEAVELERGWDHQGGASHNQTSCPILLVS
jgi:hypothetical protein